MSALLQILNTGEIDWGQVEQFDWFKALEATEQDAFHHQEKWVNIHTKMVCAEIKQVPEFATLPREKQNILVLTALLHDIAKAVTSKCDDEGRISSTGHARVGSIMARKILWEIGVPFQLRETICSIIRYHLKPFFLIEREDSKKLALEIALTTPIDLLGVHAVADIKGRICEYNQKSLDNIEMFREYMKEIGVSNKTDAQNVFGNDHSRFLYFRSQNQEIYKNAFHAPRCKVVMLSGLPGAGKDYWIKKNIDQTIPIISLDEIRRRTKSSNTGNQGHVIAEAKETAKQHLRDRSDFVWNATNLSRQLRGEVLDLFAAYNAEIHIIYVESSVDKLYEQNKNRDFPIPESAFDKIMRHWEVPDVTEAHSVQFFVDGAKM